MNKLRFFLFGWVALCGLLSAQTMPVKTLKLLGSGGTTQAESGHAATFQAGSTLTLNGTLSGTPTGGTLNLSNLSLLGSNLTASGNFTLGFGSGNTNTLNMGNLVRVERRYTGDRWPDSYPTGDSGVMVVRNPTTGDEIAVGQYLGGRHGIFFKNPHSTMEFFGLNDSSPTPFWNPVLTLLSLASGPRMQLRNIGDDDSLVFINPLNGDPTLTTENVGYGRGIKIAPLGNITLSSTGSSKAVRAFIDINRVGPADVARPFNFRTAATESSDATTRFALVLGATPENFALNRHNDAGDFTETVWLADRSNGNFTVTRNLIAGSLTANTTLTAATVVIRNGASGATANIGANTLIVDSAGQTGASILGGAAQYTTLFMGDTVDPLGFRMYYGGTNHATTADRSTWQVFTGGNLRMRMNSTVTNLTVPLSVTGNITSTANVTATGNVTGGNIITAGYVTATGNVTGGNIIATGAITPSNSDVTWTSGFGSPEGVVTANRGSLYSRRDGGAGTGFYFKESGTGNTGWIAK